MMRLRQDERLICAVVISLLLHAWVIKLNFGGQGLLGFGALWQDRRAEAPELRVALVPAPIPQVIPMEAPPTPVIKAMPPPVERPVVNALTAQPREGPVVAAPPPVERFVIKAPAPMDLDAPEPAEPRPPRAETPAPPVPLRLEPIAQVTVARMPPAITMEEPKIPTWTVPPADPPQRPAEPSRWEAERAEAARLDAEKAEAARQEAVRIEAARLEAAKVEAARIEAATLDAARVEAARVEAARLEAARIEAARLEAARIAAARLEAANAEAARLEAQKAEAARLEAARAEALRAEVARADALRAEALRAEALRGEALRAEALRAEAARAEAVRAQARQEEEAREARIRTLGQELDAQAQRRKDAEREPLPLSVGSARRYRLFGRSDPDEAVARYAEVLSRKLEMNMTYDLVREALKQPHADPTVTVAVRGNGSVESITFVGSSGVAALDEAIRRVVQSQAPFPVFPPALALQYDVIEIRRTWHFDVGIHLD